MNDEMLRLFEQPVSGDTAVLTCTHRQPLPKDQPRDQDGWWTAIHCPQCQRRRAVVSVIRPKAER